MVFSSGTDSVSWKSLATIFLSLAIVPVLYILIDRVRESIWKRFKVDRLLRKRLILMRNRRVLTAINEAITISSSIDIQNPNNSP
jgi:hypothetical protein